MHDSTTLTARRIPISFWISAGLFVVYSALGVVVCIELSNDALNILALLVVSPLLFVGMVISVIDIVRTRKRGRTSSPYVRLQWWGLALTAGAMPLWLMIAIVGITLFS